jgi:hypothetical protein
LATIGLGFDYRAITEGKYSFSVYAGAQGMAVLGAAAVFGVIHVRNTWMISDNLAFSVGLKYLPQFLL